MRLHWMMATLALLAAGCDRSDVGSPLTGAFPDLGGRLDVQASDDMHTVEVNGERYSQIVAKSYPLIDMWDYRLPGEIGSEWSKRFEIDRYKKVDAQEIYDQMVGTVTHANQLAQKDDVAKVVCFVVERDDGQEKEPQVWRYVDSPDGLTYANGIIWKKQAGMAFNTFMKGEFLNTCDAMAKADVVMPTPLEP